jgi:hypothetical protein
MKLAFGLPLYQTYYQSRHGHLHDESKRDVHVWDDSRFNIAVVIKSQSYKARRKHEGESGFCSACNFGILSLLLLHLG